MDGGMGAMMSSMMGRMLGIGLLGWVLVIALFVTIVVLLFRLLSRGDRAPVSPGPGHRSDRSPTH